MDKRVYILSAIAFVVGMSELIVGGILDLIANELEVLVSTAGILITIFAIVFAISPPILLVVFAKVERTKLAAISLIVFLIGIIIAAVSPNFTLLMISRIISAASGSLATVLSINLASRIVEAPYRGRAIGLVVMGISGSLVLGLPIGVLLGNLFNWRAPFIMVAILTLFLLVVMKFTLEKIEPTAIISLKAQIKTLTNKTILLAHATTFFFLAGHYTLYGYLTPYLKATLNFSGITISVVYFVFGFAAVLGGGLAGVLTDRIGKKRTLFSAIVLLMGSLFFMPISVHFIPLFWIALVIWGVMSWGITPPIQSHLFEVAPEMADVQQSLNNAFLQFGIAFGTLLGSLIIELRTIEETPFFGNIFVLFALIAAFITMHKRSLQRANES